MLSANEVRLEKARELAVLAGNGGIAPALPGEQEGQGIAREAGFVLSNGLTVGMGVAASAMVLQVLVVDDDEGLRKACGEVADAMGCAVTQAESVSAAKAILKFQKIDLLLLDLRLPGNGGLDLLEQVKAMYPDTSVVVMTAFATVASAVEAMQVGASDYLTKPFVLDSLKRVIERARKRVHFHEESRQLRERLRTSKGMGGLIGQSPEMEKLYRILSKVAFSTHPVLIFGESGTGKETVARLIHSSGPNGAKQFMPVDCGSLSPAAIESELFGYVKGALAGSHKAKEGLLTAAHGGTIFLDEIGELPQELQAKLLRALQEREAKPMGGSDAIPLSARVLAATHRDLGAMVEAGQFRKDLYYRLNVVNLRIPPLRDRKQDIHALALHFLEKMELQAGTVWSFSDDALRVMMDYDWPGNVRELEQTIERACTLSSGPVLHMGDLPTQLQDFRMHRAAEIVRMAEVDEAALDGVLVEGIVGGDRSAGIASIAAMEKDAILGTIQHLKGDKLMAAKLLGIGKTTLYRKLKEYGISDAGEHLN